jgi:ribosomal protein S27E
MLIFFSSSFYPCIPCNVGLYSPVGGKNELEEKKINIARGTKINPSNFVRLE